MSDYTSYGYEIVPGMGPSDEGEIYIVPPQDHRGVIELTEDDLLLLLSELRIARDQAKKG
mgnify:CR=1 FL=1